MRRIRFWADCRPHEAMGIAATTFGEFEVFFGEYENGEEVWRPNKPGSSLREVREWLEQNNKETYEFVQTQRPDRRGWRQYTVYIRNMREPVEEIVLKGKSESVLKRIEGLLKRFGGEILHHERPTRINGGKRLAVINPEPKSYAAAKAWLVDQENPEEPVWVKEGYPNSDFWKWT